MNLTENITEDVQVSPYTPEEIKMLYSLYFWILGVFITFICTIGLITNLMNIIFLSRSIKQPFYKIFLGMAIADSITMAVILSYAGTHTLPKTLRYKDPPEYEGPYSRYVWHNTWFLAVTITFCISNWCAVLLSVFRLLVVSFPLKASTLASGKRVAIAVILVYIGSFLVQIPNWIRFWYEDGVAQEKEKSSLILIQVLFNSPIPWTICMISTVLLGCLLALNRRKMRESIKKEVMRERSREQKQLTVTLLLVVIVFVLLNIPNLIYQCISETGGNKAFARLNISRFNQNIFYITQFAMTVISYANNFFIYMMGSASMRNEFLTTFRLRSPRLTESSGQSTAQTSAGKSAVSSG